MAEERRRRAYDATKISDIKSGASPDVYHIGTGWPLRKVIDFLAQHRVGLVIVIGPEGTLEGVISERDIVRAIYEHGGDALDVAVDAYMSRDVYTCSSDDLARDVAHVMASKGYRHAPIVDDGYMAGMVSASDLVRYFADRM